MGVHHVHQVAAADDDAAADKRTDKAIEQRVAEMMVNTGYTGRAKYKSWPLMRTTSEGMCQEGREVSLRAACHWQRQWLDTTVKVVFWEWSGGPLEWLLAFSGSGFLPRH